MGTSVVTEQKAPFDGKMIIVIVMTFAVWVGYQGYLRKKYPEAYNPAKVAATNPDGKEVATATAGADELTAQSPSSEKISSASNAAQNANQIVEEKTIAFEDDTWTILVSNKGMGIPEIILANYTDRDNKNIRFVATEESLNLETNIIGSAKPLYFDLKRTADKQITGIANFSGMKIVKTYNFDSDRYLIRAELSIENPIDSFSGITTKISDRVKKPASSSFFNPQQNHQEFYISYDGTSDRQVLAPDVEEQKTFHKVNIASLASQYFAFAVIDKSKSIPDFQTRLSKGPNDAEGNLNGNALGVMTHFKLPGQSIFSVTLESYAGPKSYDFLERVSAELTSLVNFGFFQTLAKWIFKLLQIIHAALGNWGLAIIALTVLVRVCVMPFNIMSYRSMKAMSVVQPQLKQIREKYKNDSQMANKEIMRVMKEAKANPIGGCLPMLLQIPVFFALYQVLGQSIELYKAPFAFWIMDLSLKDPYFVLPVLMGATMFVQQKITPTTMEPAQQKILMFMPVFLTFLLASLPSGLTLYMFVSTLFGVLQQLYFMRDEKRRAVATA